MQESMNAIRYCLIIIFILFFNNSLIGDTAADNIIKASQDYICSNGDKDDALGKKLEAYNGSIEAVLNKLKESEPKNWQNKTPSGKIVKFSLPQFKTSEFNDKFPESCLYYYVPKDYSPDKPFGLLLYLHGGGPGVSPLSARIYVTKYKLDKQVKSNNLPYIIVAPSYKNKGKSLIRWLRPESDEFLDSVIRESMYRFNIAPNKIILSGFSMGGSGAWHHAQRMSDRIAAMLTIAGGWRAVNFKGYTGLPMFIIFGQYDAFRKLPKIRKPRKADPEKNMMVYADQELTKLKIPHEFRWHIGGHTPLGDAAPEVSKFCEWAKDKKRNPFSPEVFALTPSGAFVHIKGFAPTLHNRWISILKTEPGPLEYQSYSDKKTSGSWRPEKGETPEQFYKRRWKKHAVRQYLGAWVDAKYSGNNNFDVKTKNVKKFAIWLHPKMIDFKKAVTVNVNGKKHSFKGLKPNLKDALKSYKRKKDWGLVYPKELVISVP